jgi:hypothetical protein
MTYIYNPQQLEASENTYVTAIAFSTFTGVLTATRNDGVELTTDLDDRYVQENTHTTSASFSNTTGVLTLNQTDPVGTVTVDLDGRFPTENTHLDTATLGSNNVLSLGMVNPTSTITVNLSNLADLNTHLDSASFSSSTKKLTLNMVNPTSQIEVDLSGIEGANTYVTSANFTDGTLELTRNDSGTVSVDLDGRYATQNTHVEDMTFNTTTRELKLDLTDPTSELKVTIPGGPDENTYLTELAFNKDSGGLVATLNNSTTVNTDLDGRYLTEDENTHLSSATYNTDTSVLRLSMVNPASNIDVTIETEDQLNTHLDSAALDLTTLELNMVNPTSQITVDLGSLITGKYLPITFTESEYSGDLNSLISAGVYKVSSTALNRPPDIQGSTHYVCVYSNKIADSNPTAVTQIWTTAVNQSDGLNPNTRMWIRVYSSGSVPIVSPWQEINNGGLNGYLRGVMVATGRDFNADRYRQSGYYFVDNVNSETQGWSNGPSNFPDSQFNILKTVMLGVNSTNLSYGNGYQELSTATYDTENNHVRTWKRSFEASSTVENYTEWFEVFHQGIPIELEAQKVTNSVDSRTIIDVSNVRVLNLNLGINYSIREFTNGVEGQIVTIIKTNKTGFVRVWHWDSFNGGNIITPQGPETAANLRNHRSCAFIKVGTYWYPYNWESSSS